MGVPHVSLVLRDMGIPVGTTERIWKDKAVANKVDVVSAPTRGSKATSTPPVAVSEILRMPLLTSLLFATLEEDFIFAFEGRRVHSTILNSLAEKGTASKPRLKAQQPHPCSRALGYRLIHPL